MRKTAIIIPARYNSSRLPGKPLLVAGGKTIIQHVWERAKSVKSADEVIIATDDARIFDTVKSFGANVEMTDVNHSCGSERIAEVTLRHEDFDIIVNIQGDEPGIEPSSVEKIVNMLKNDKNADIATLCTKIKDENEKNNPAAVKVVFDKNGYAMYFSRSVIPFERNKGVCSHYRHIGIYGYGRKALFKMIASPQAECEKAESLEQLRALYEGLKIKVAIIPGAPVGIDTPEDFENFRNSVEDN